MKNIKTYEEYKGVTFEEYLTSYSNLYSFINFNSSYSDIISLIGVEKLINLESLSCYNNRIESLDGLEKSTKLRELYCWLNKITSLNEIENLINLTELDCEDNKITSLKPILNLTKLTGLHCQENPIDYVDYIDKRGRTYYIKLPKSIKSFRSDKFTSIGLYWKWFEENQPSGISRKFNF